MASHTAIAPPAPVAPTVDESAALDAALNRLAGVPQYTPAEAAMMVRGADVLAAHPEIPRTDAMHRLIRIGNAHRAVDSPRRKHIPTPFDDAVQKAETALAAADLKLEFALRKLVELNTAFLAAKAKAGREISYANDHMQIGAKASDPDAAKRAVETAQLAYQDQKTAVDAERARRDGFVRPLRRAEAQQYVWRRQHDPIYSAGTQR